MNENLEFLGSLLLTAGHIELNFWGIRLIFPGGPAEALGGRGLGEVWGGRLGIL